MGCHSSKTSDSSELTISTQALPTSSGVTTNTTVITVASSVKRVHSKSILKTPLNVAVNQNTNNTTVVSTNNSELVPPITLAPGAGGADSKHSRQNSSKQSRGEQSKSHGEQKDTVPAHANLAVQEMNTDSLPSNFDANQLQLQLPPSGGTTPQFSPSPGPPSPAGIGLPRALSINHSKNNSGPNSVAGDTDAELQPRSPMHRVKSHPNSPRHDSANSQGAPTAAGAATSTATGDKPSDAPGFIKLASHTRRRSSLKLAGAPAREIPSKSPVIRNEGHVRRKSVDGGTTTADAAAATMLHPRPPNKKRLTRRNSHSAMMSKLALKFPLIRKSFQLVHEVFVKFYQERLAAESVKANARGSSNTLQLVPVEFEPMSPNTRRRNGIFDIETISCDKLKAVLAHIGEQKTWSDEEVKALFSVADLDGSQTISFREFLICIAVGYYLKIESDDEKFKSIQKGFKVVEQSFKDMDVDNSKSVDAAELKKALFSAQSQQDAQLLETRFRELDFDGDGDIYFPEFLYGFVSWVGFLEE